MIGVGDGTLQDESRGASTAIAHGGHAEMRLAVLEDGGEGSRDPCARTTHGRGQMRRPPLVILPAQWMAQCHRAAPNVDALRIKT